MDSRGAWRGQNRRTFLGRLLTWTTTVAAVFLSWPLFRFLGFSVPPKPRYVTVKAPLPASGVHIDRDFLLFGDNKNRAHAVSRVCTHLGCRVNFLEDRQLIECPCHQSRFTPEGQRIAGPAKRDLPFYPVEIKRDSDGTVTSYIVTL
ncbi:QcrA and Rieske domain-containing protein [Desulfolithobacter sp.]